MKLVILGGSSSSTPALFRSLRLASALPPMEMWLVGRSREHLDGVLRVSRMILDGAPVTIHSSSFAKRELSVALANADVVLVQVRLGGYEGRHFDETFPLAYGICGDEGLGPGGLAAAWRGWPVMQQLLSDVSSVCPNALVLMLSAPLGIFVGAAQQAFPGLSVVGICELPWTTLQQFAASRAVDVRNLEFGYIGLNHLGWFYRIEAQARDLLDEYKHVSTCENAWPPPGLVAACGGFPTKYLRAHYHSSQVLAEQKRQRKSRAHVLEDISGTCYRTFSCGDMREILHALNLRSTPWYEHAVVPLIFSLAGAGDGGPFFVTGCTRTQFEFSGMWETPARVVDGQLRIEPPCSPPPEAIAQVVRSFVAYEAQAISAVVAQDVVGLRNALNAHPWVPTAEAAYAMARTISSQAIIAAA